MEEFGPGDTNHRRVPWPDEWQSEPSILLPPWVTHNLAHNFPLSNQDRERVDQLRSSISLQISEKEEALKQIQRDIESLKKGLFACDVVQSPARTLPHDVLHYVGSLCSLVYPPSAIYSHPKSHTPSILAQVSKQWRDAIEGNCSAWQHMRFNSRIWNGIFPKDPLLDRIERFGRLSGTLPMSLQLDERNPDDDEDYQDGFPVALDWVLREWEDRDRLKSLTIFTPSPYFLLDEVEQEDLENPTSLGFPANIESFRLLNWVGDVDRCWLGGDSITDLLTIWQSLRHLWIGGPYTEAEIGQEDVYEFGWMEPESVWHRLKTLYIEKRLIHDEWVECLRNCRELEAAWLYITGHDQDFMSSVTAMTHVHLTELHFGLSDFKDPILPYFLNLQFPVLNSLHLHFLNSDPSSASSAQPKDFTNVFPALENLFIHETGGSRLAETLGGIFPLILAVPTVTSLWTSISHRHILEFLEVFKGKRLPLPNLRICNVQFIAEPSSTWLTPAQELRLTDALILTRQKRPAVLPPSTVGTTSSKNSKVHAGLAEMNVLYRFYDSADVIVDKAVSRGMGTKMFQYFTNLREKFVKEGVDIKVELDWVQDSEALMFHEGRAEREFMKRFDRV